MDSFLLAFLLNSVCILHPMRNTYLDHLVLVDLIILILFGEESSYEASHYVVFSNLLLIRKIKTPREQNENKLNSSSKTETYLDGLHLFHS
jgi:hypothetical protein